VGACTDVAVGARATVEAGVAVDASATGVAITAAVAVGAGVVAVGEAHAASKKLKAMREYKMRYVFIMCDFFS
jgi:hypothetical protein